MMNAVPARYDGLLNQPAALAISQRSRKCTGFASETH
jgi:hypothetical protein